MINSNENNQTFTVKAGIATNKVPFFFKSDCLVKNMHGIIKGYVLVNDWGVSRPVFIDYRHHESDEFWPEVQVLYRRTLLLPGNVLLPALWRHKLGWQELAGSLSASQVKL